MFSYGYPLASLPSYRTLTYETRTKRMRLLMYLRDISHYQGEPTTGTKEVREKERRPARLFFFSFYPTDVLARIDAYVHALDPDWRLKYTREFILARVVELIGIAVWVRVIAGSQTRRYRPLPVHVSAPANTFLLLRVHPKRTHHLAS